MSAKHTQGPWNAFNSIKAIGVGSERSDVAWVRFEECGLMDTARSQEEDEANARLIAAAPELLEALRMTSQALAWLAHGKCRGFHPGLPTADESLDAARAAIAKAIG